MYITIHVQIQPGICPLIFPVLTTFIPSEVGALEYQFPGERHDKIKVCESLHHWDFCGQEGRWGRGAKEAGDRGGRGGPLQAVFGAQPPGPVDGLDLGVKGFLCNSSRGFPLTRGNPQRMQRLWGALKASVACLSSAGELSHPTQTQVLNPPASFCPFLPAEKGCAPVCTPAHDSPLWGSR